jgi:hypothetical protein
MLKFLYISDSKENKFAFNIFNKIAESDFSDNISGEIIERLLIEKKPHFLYLDIRRPVNKDIMNRLCINELDSLRVSVFRIKPFKSRVLNFIFPIGTIEKIILGLFNHPYLKKESRLNQIPTHSA